MKSLREKFFELMNDTACDLAETLFVSQEEKADYINYVWNNCIDEVECYFAGEIGEWENQEDFEKHLIDAYNDSKINYDIDEYYNEIMLSAIYENRALIF